MPRGEGAPASCAFDLHASVEGEVIVVATASKDSHRGPTVGQKLCVEAIEEKLRTQKVSFELRDVTQSQVAQHFEGVTMEAFILDPSDRIADTIDPETTVSGSAKDMPVREAVDAMLKPLGLRLVV